MESRQMASKNIVAAAVGAKAVRIHSRLAIQMSAVKRFYVPIRNAVVYAVLNGRSVYRVIP